MVRNITTTTSEEFYELAKTYNISWSEALRIGIAILLLERGEKKFNSPLNNKRLENLKVNL